MKLLKWLINGSLVVLGLNLAFIWFRIHEDDRGDEHTATAAFHLNHAELLNAARHPRRLLYGSPGRTPFREKFKDGWSNSPAEIRPVDHRSYYDDDYYDRNGGGYHQPASYYYYYPENKGYLKALLLLLALPFVLVFALAAFQSLLNNFFLFLQRYCNNFNNGIGTTGDDLLQLASNVNDATVATNPSSLFGLPSFVFLNVTLPDSISNILSLQNPFQSNPLVG